MICHSLEMGWQIDMMLSTQSLSKKQHPDRVEIVIVICGCGLLLINRAKIVKKDSSY